MRSLSLPLAALLAALLAPGVAGADEPPGHKPTAWERKEFARHRQDAMAFGNAYRDFLGRHKTEREVVEAAVGLARARGFRDLHGARRPSLGPGARVLVTGHGKIAAFAVLGERPLAEGVRLVAAHIDAVRIDLKQNPVYGSGNAAWLQTQYYGSIKSYQWLSLPLELRGVVVKKGGEVVRIAIGDDPDEPVLVIPDVAAHLSHLVDAIEGEQVPGEALDPIVSSTPAARVLPGQDPFAAEAARLLESLHGIAADDLAAAELALVPAGLPRDVGLDRALIGGHGQDDRAGSYAALRAILDLGTPRHTAIVLLVDRQAVGSAGVTGARSRFFRRLIAELIEATGGPATELAVDRLLARSLVMVADATAAVHAQYPGLHEPRNAAFLGAGVVWDRSAAHAEVMAYVRGLLDRSGITHQTATRRQGPGRAAASSILPFFTQHGMSGLRVSIPLLSMHAPFELVSRADLYEAFRACKAFLADPAAPRPGG